jgi:DNA-binding Xre family transcriptional regulator
VADNRLDNKLAKFLRAKLGDLSYLQFSDKMGLTASSLHRIERDMQSVTPGALEKICERLNCQVTDIFGFPV